MDELVRALVRWHETRLGMRAGDDAEAYQRAHDRLRALSDEQRRATRADEPRWTQREVAIAGEVGGEARGRFRLRNPSSRVARVAVRAAGASVPVRVEHPEEIAPGRVVECRVIVDLRSTMRPALIEVPLDVEVESAFRMRVWITVEVV